MSARRTVYDTQVTHVRRTPWRRAFVHRSSMWVVDIDAYQSPRRRRDRLRSVLTGTVETRDHLDGGPGSLRQSLERFAACEGFALGNGRVLLAAQPRALGFCFNPISVWWSLDTEENLVATVVEVHNTYGDRHAYLLERPEGRSVVDKAMYVSPFHGVDGSYYVVAPLPDERLDLAVTLVVAANERFSARLVGQRLAQPPWWTALASLRDATLIRIHGTILWARGLRIHPRPAHQQEALK